MYHYYDTLQELANSVSFTDGSNVQCVYATWQISSLLFKWSTVTNNGASGYTLITLKSNFVNDLILIIFSPTRGIQYMHTCIHVYINTYSFLHHTPSLFLSSHNRNITLSFSSPCIPPSLFPSLILSYNITIPLSSPLSLTFIFTCLFHRLQSFPDITVPGGSLSLLSTEHSAPITQ